VEKGEREFVLRHLGESRERLIMTVEGLSEAQRNFRPAEDGWSAADCVEHLAVIEAGALKLVQAAVQTPPQPSQEPDVPGKDRLILETVPSRDVPIKGPAALMPSGRWPEFEELMRQFEAARERTLRFAAVTQADLRCHFLPHPVLGVLDCYQWLLLIAAHSERHVRQIEAIQNDERFPRGLATSA